MKEKVLTAIYDVCSVCNVRQDIAFLVKRTKSKLGYQKLCLDCKNKKSKNNILAKERQAQRQRELREFVGSFKDVPCYDCKVKYPRWVMDFDHMPQFKKSFNLSQSVGKSKEEILLEIAKCQVVCSNCHRTRTHQRMSMM